MKLRELTNDEFLNFSKSYNIKSIYQTVEYALVMNKQKFDAMFIGLIDENNYIVAASLILIEKSGHFKYAYAPRGFLIDYCNHNVLKTFTEEIKRFLGKKNIIAIKISPYIIRNTYDTKYNVVTKNNYYDNILQDLQQLGYYHLGYNEKFEALKPRYEAIIDLDIPYYMIFKNFKKSLRTKIRSAEMKGVKIYKGTEENLSYLYLQTKKKYPRDLKYFEECYNQFSKSNNIEFFYAKIDTEAYLKNIQKKYTIQEELCTDINNKIMKNTNQSNKYITQKLEADKQFDQYKKELIKATKMLRDNPEGIVVASALIIKNKNEVFLLMDGYDPNYKKMNAKHLLLWKLCERYAKSGFKKFNLNGIAGINNTPEEYKGLNEFKLNFNAHANEYIGDLELITNNALYFMYQNTSPIRNILKR